MLATVTCISTVPTTRNRQQAKSGQSLRPGQAEQESCKKGLRNSRTEVPTPEAGALLSGLITVPTSTRGICVHAYTQRKERERETVWSETKGREGKRCNTVRCGVFMRVCTDEQLSDAHRCADSLSACKARFCVRSNTVPRDLYTNRSQVTREPPRKGTARISC